MLPRPIITTAIALTGAALAFVGMTAARRSPTVERIDFDHVARATTPAYDAKLAPASDADIKDFRIPIKDASLEIAKGVKYEGWTFGGTVPGPVLRIGQGDRVRVNVVN